MSTLAARRDALFSLVALAHMQQWHRASAPSLGRMAHAALRYARLARHPLTANARLTACREVVARLLGRRADLYAIPAVRDARAINKRSAPPPRQVPHMPFQHYRAARARAHTRVRRCMDVIWASLARPSDWLGSTGVSRPPVPLADVQLLAPGLVEALYRRSKPDQEGLGRRVRLRLPQSTWEWLRLRKSTHPPSHPALPISIAELRKAFAPYPLRSVRRGTVRLALLQGLSARKVMAVTGHKSEQTVLRYAGLMCPKRAAHSAAVSLAVLRPAPRFRSMSVM